MNGQVGKTLGPKDRGLAYGDGLFESICVLDGQPRLLARHLHRLSVGCQRLRLPVDRLGLAQEIQAFSQALQQGVCKLILTRGEGQRGYTLPESPQPTRILLGSPPAVYPESYAQRGIRVYTCATRLAEQPLLAGLKHLNRLEQVLARAEWQGTDYAEGLLCDTHGRVVEGVFSNLFLVVNSILVTPALGRCGVAGVMREEILLRAPKLGFKVQIRDVLPTELAQATEVFFCNSQYGIWPVYGLGALHWSVGPVTRRLQDSLGDLMVGRA